MCNKARGSRNRSITEHRKETNSIAPSFTVDLVVVRRAQEPGQQLGFQYHGHYRISPIYSPLVYGLTTLRWGKMVHPPRFPDHVTRVHPLLTHSWGKSWILQSEPRRIRTFCPMRRSPTQANEFTRTCLTSRLVLCSCTGAKTT